jgi:cytochrome c oxidase cbb3-type subunit III
MRSFLYLSGGFFLFSGVAMGQDKTTEAAESVTQAAVSGNFYMNILLVVFLITALLLLWCAFTLLKAFQMMARELAHPTQLVRPEPQPIREYAAWQAEENAKPGLWARILSLRPLHEEKDMTLDHEFDGITELDNPTPPWFNWLFAVSIIFAIGYFLNYEVFSLGPDQDQEYRAEMKVAEEERKIYLASSSNNVDENSVKESKEPAVLSSGKAIYDANCTACHGDKLQGLVGPNLTDEYWLHGGQVNKVFKTIKYGVPEKGMISWEKTLTPKQIADVSNYILSLKGTNPDGAKEPQGEKEG